MSNGFFDQHGTWIPQRGPDFTSTRLTAERYRFVPDHGEPCMLLAETEAEAQTYCAEVFHGIPGAIFHTGEFYKCERFTDGYIRALTDGRLTLAEELSEQKGALS